jgi:phytoene synthase
MTGATRMDDSLVANGAAAIRHGSRSFAAAAELFHPDVRAGVVTLYAWCRYCDDVVDGQDFGFGQRMGDRSDAVQRLAELREATDRACAKEATDSPIFAGIAEVVRRYQLPKVYLDEHLDGFAMDVSGRRYAHIEDTLEYCWRVAGVVGVMMSHVMGRSDPDTLDRACDLGIAFQLTNIARDIVEDAAIDRIYLPADWLVAEGLPTTRHLADEVHRPQLARVATRLVALAERYYDSAMLGLNALPFRSAWSVATARSVYREIGRKVVARGPQAWDARAGTNKFEKTWWLVVAAAQAVASRAPRTTERDPSLLRRPL